MYAQTHTHTHTHICMYTHTHTLIHTQQQRYPRHKRHQFSATLSVSAQAFRSCGPITSCIRRYYYTASVLCVCQCVRLCQCVRVCMHVNVRKCVCVYCVWPPYRHKATDIETQIYNYRYWDTDLPKQLYQGTRTWLLYANFTTEPNLPGGAESLLLP